MTPPNPTTYRELHRLHQYDVRSRFRIHQRVQRPLPLARTGDPVKFALWSLDQDAEFFEGTGPAPRMLEVVEAKAKPDASREFAAESNATTWRGELRSMDEVGLGGGTVGGEVGDGAVGDAMGGGARRVIIR